MAGLAAAGSQESDEGCGEGDDSEEVIRRQADGLAGSQAIRRDEEAA